MAYLSSAGMFELGSKLLSAKVMRCLDVAVSALLHARYGINGHNQAR